jgi:large subunit ribosomal protein L30
MSTLKVTQRKSRNGCDSRQLDTLRSLGLRRIGHTVQHDDTPAIRGMIHKVRHLVEVAESAGADSGASSPGGERRGAKS